MATSTCFKEIDAFLNRNALLFRNGVCMVIGNFDGVHLGHQALLQLAKNIANEMPVVVLTFDPHPREILGNQTILRLTDNTHREEKLRLYGADEVLTLPFTHALADMTASQFVQTVLVERLNMRHLVIGHDFSLGKGRDGSCTTLCELGQQWNFSVTQHPPFCVGNTLVSSSLIRALLTEGNVNDAARLLGSSHRLHGVVVQGDQRGRLLGFPTANIAADVNGTPLQVLLPKVGVYAVLAGLEGEQGCAAVANIGYNPTFGSGALRVEVHLLHRTFGADELYGKQLSVGFVSRLRDEQTFATVEALKRQIEHDIIAAQAVFTLKIL